MNMDTVSILSLSFGCAGVLLLLVSQWPVHQELRIARKEISRFPLFAARDHLISLALTGEMKEDDYAWRATYVAVNKLLGMKRKLHALDCTWSFLRFQVALHREPDLQKRVEGHRAAVEAACSEVPEFAEVRSEVEQGVTYMMARRTTVWHLLGLLGILVAVCISVGLLVAGAASVKQATAIYRSLSTHNRGPALLEYFSTPSTVC